MNTNQKAIYQALHEAFVDHTETWNLSQMTDDLNLTYTIDEYSEEDVYKTLSDGGYLGINDNGDLEGTFIGLTAWSVAVNLSFHVDCAVAATRFLREHCETKARNKNADTEWSVDESGEEF